MRSAAEILEGLPELDVAPKQIPCAIPVCATEPVDRPGDDYNNRGDIRPLLQKHGWTFSHESPDGNQHWTRPGKDHATSATLKDGVFYVFTSNGVPFEQNKGYSHFQVYALLEHNGDFSKAAAQLRIEGFGDEPQTPVNLNGILKSIASNQEDWPKPIPFDFGRELPSFPVGSIEAPWLREMVCAVTESTQTPSDLAGSLALAILGLCGAGKMRVCINESWSEPLNLFTVCSLPPGCRKSAVFGAMVEPLIQWERTETDRLRPKIAEARAAYEFEEQRLKELKVRAARESDSAKREQMKQEAQGIAVLLATKTLPSLPRLFTDDVTPEQLARLLTEHAGRMAVLSPEAEIFEILAGRYSEGANIGCFLKGHAGDALRVDRVGRPADFVDKPALTVALACQPDVIEGLSSKPGFRGRGLLGRFLYTLPESPLGYRDVDAKPVPDSVTNAYHQNILRLLDLTWDMDDYGNPKPFRLNLSPEARELHRAFQKELEPQLAHDGELGTLTDWAGKLAGAIARMAGGLHLAKCDGSFEIEGSTMRHAIALGRFFTVHAQAAFMTMGADPHINIAKRILAWIERHGVTNFARREVCRPLHLETNEADVAFKLLIEHEYLRQHTSLANPNRTGRKPGPVFEVNPFLRSKF